MSDITHVLVTGAAGRMGKEVVRLIQSPESGMKVVAAVDRAGKADAKEMPDVSAGAVEVVIDFSSPELFRDVLRWCFQRKVPLVSGTTGLTDEDQKLINDAAESIPILWAPNMSLGVALLNRLIKQFHSVADNFDFQIEEFHHRYKKDQPSGTALLLQKTAEEELGGTSEPPLSVRGGGIFGIHKFWAMSDEETLCLEHTALNRTVFARGAVNAAQWVKNKKPGRYKVADLLQGPDFG